MTAGEARHVASNPSDRHSQQDSLPARAEYYTFPSDVGFESRASIHSTVHADVGNSQDLGLRGFSAKSLPRDVPLTRERAVLEVPGEDCPVGVEGLWRAGSVSLKEQVMAAEGPQLSAQQQPHVIHYPGEPLPTEVPGAGPRNRVPSSQEKLRRPRKGWRHAFAVALCIEPQHLCVPLLGEDLVHGSTTGLSPGTGDDGPTIRLSKAQALRSIGHHLEATRTFEGAKGQNALSETLFSCSQEQEKPTDTRQPGACGEQAQGPCLAPRDTVARASRSGKDLVVSASSPTELLTSRYDSRRGEKIDVAAEAWMKVLEVDEEVPAPLTPEKQQTAEPSLHQEAPLSGCHPTKRETQAASMGHVVKPAWGREDETSDSRHINSSKSGDQETFESCHSSSSRTEDLDRERGVGRVDDWTISATDCNMQLMMELVQMKMRKHQHMRPANLGQVVHLKPAELGREAIRTQKQAVKRENKTKLKSLGSAAPFDMAVTSQSLTARVHAGADPRSSKAGAAGIQEQLASGVQPAQSHSADPGRAEGGALGPVTNETEDGSSTLMSYSGAAKGDHDGQGNSTGRKGQGSNTERTSTQQQHPRSGAGDCQEPDAAPCTNTAASPRSPRRRNPGTSPSRPWRSAAPTSRPGTPARPGAHHTAALPLAGQVMASEPGPGAGPLGDAVSLRSGFEHPLVMLQQAHSKPGQQYLAAAAAGAAAGDSLPQGQSTARVSGRPSAEHEAASQRMTPPEAPGHTFATQQKNPTSRFPGDRARGGEDPSAGSGTDGEWVALAQALKLAEKQALENAQRCRERLKFLEASELEFRREVEMLTPIAKGQPHLHSQSQSQSSLHPEAEAPAELQAPETQAVDFARLLRTPSMEQARELQGLGQGGPLRGGSDDVAAALAKIRLRVGARVTADRRNRLSDSRIPSSDCLPGEGDNQSLVGPKGVVSWRTVLGDKKMSRSGNDGGALAAAALCNQGGLSPGSPLGVTSIDPEVPNSKDASPRAPGARPMLQPVVTFEGWGEDECSPRTSRPEELERLFEQQNSMKALLSPLGAPVSLSPKSRGDGSMPAGDRRLKASGLEDSASECSGLLPARGHLPMNSAKFPGSPFPGSPKPMSSFGYPWSDDEGEEVDRSFLEEEVGKLDFWGDLMEDKALAEDLMLPVSPVRSGWDDAVSAQSSQPGNLALGGGVGDQAGHAVGGVTTGREGAATVRGEGSGPASPGRSGLSQGKLARGPDWRRRREARGRAKLRELDSPRGARRDDCLAQFVEGHPGAILLREGSGISEAPAGLHRRHKSRTCRPVECVVSDSEVSADGNA